MEAENNFLTIWVSRESAVSCMRWKHEGSPRTSGRAVELFHIPSCVMNVLPCCSLFNCDSEAFLFWGVGIINNNNKKKTRKIYNLFLYCSISVYNCSF